MKVAVGLSGGVDSAVTALLLRERGYEVVGITMKLWRGTYVGGARDACFGPGEAEDIARAGELAEAIGIPYHVYDCAGEYERKIIGYFRRTYLDGRTPNPCVFCNAAMKFGLLPELAKASGLDFDAFATGHYARVEKTEDRCRLLRARDIAKDQSYFLYRLSQAQLRRHLFPMGDLTKSEVRAIAREHSLIVADQPDSQDFYSGDIAELIGEPDRPGDLVDTAGKVLGRHRGFWHYTIGQRKGLGLPGGGTPYYVIAIDACRNRVVVGRADEGLTAEIQLEDMNWVSIAETSAPIDCLVKVRSAGKLLPATIEGGRCRFAEPAQGVAPGQSAVIYSSDGEVVLCGGVML